jgi:GxxExxY protein
MKIAPLVVRYRNDRNSARPLLAEVKAVQEVVPVHKAQLMSYMKLLDVALGLILNFHEPRLTDGVFRLILPGANR